MTLSNPVAVVFVISSIFWVIFSYSAVAFFICSAFESNSDFNCPDNVSPVTTHESIYPWICAMRSVVSWDVVSIFDNNSLTVVLNFSVVAPTLSQSGAPTTPRKSDTVFSKRWAITAIFLVASSAVITNLSFCSPSDFFNSWATAICPFSASRILLNPDSIFDISSAKIVFNTRTASATRARSGRVISVNNDCITRCDLRETKNNTANATTNNPPIVPQIIHNI